MAKNFNLWNENKKRIHYSELIKPYQERDIWWCWLGINVGFEEDGSGVDAERPVLILKGFSSQLCLIVPLSTVIKKNPYYLSVKPLDGKEVSVIISQLRLIDTRRLINKSTYLDKKQFDVIKQAIKDYL